jgi:carbon-monoxide dehydrogenase small subunit
MGDFETIIELTINGNKEKLAVKNNWTLLEILRGKMNLTGTKCGCNKGECGACTVLMNGKAVLSCLTMAIAADEQEIITIEGLTGDDSLHPIQQAFIDHGAVQCGFCTPGMIMSAKALLDEIPNPTEQEIRYGINGNICRCTGYAKIVEAIESISNNDR